MSSLNQNVAPSSSRVEWIDLLKGLGILLVVLGHSFANERTKTVDSCMLVKGMIYGFHMPMFFLAAGAASYFSMNKLNSVASYLMRLLYGVFLPYVCAAFLSGFIFLTPEKWQARSYEVILDAFLRGTVMMWFLPALLILQITYALYFKMTKKVKSDWLQIILAFPFMVGLFVLHRLFGQVTIADKSEAVHWLTNAYQAFVPFFFGAVILRYDWTRKLVYKNNIVYMLCLVFTLALIQQWGSCPYSLYVKSVLGVCVSVVLIRYSVQYQLNDFVKSQLVLLGKHSLCLYLFGGMFQVSCLFFDMPGMHPLLVVLVYGSLSLIACYACVLFAKFIEISPILRLCFLGKK